VGNKTGIRYKERDMTRIFSLISVVILLAFVAGCMGDDRSTEARPEITDQVDLQTGATDLETEGDTEDETETGDTKAEASDEDSPPVVTPLKEDECSEQEPVTFVRYSSKKQLHLMGAPFRKTCEAYGECSLTVQAKGGSGEYFMKVAGLPKDLVVEGMGFSGTLKNPATYIAAIVISDKKCLQNYVVVPFELTVAPLYIE
jgi:hypothetical protein